MVNAPQMWRERRLREIAIVQESIKKGIKSGKKLEMDKLILFTMANLGTNKTKAKEYVEIALFNEGIELKNGERNTLSRHM